VELVCKIPIEKGALAENRLMDKANMLKLGTEHKDAEKFQEIGNDLGVKLLGPLYGRCFDYVSSHS
jgi:hypothetical protein